MEEKVSFALNIMFFLNWYREQATLCYSELRTRRDNSYR